jgi:chromosome segregation ATPase
VTREIANYTRAVARGDFSSLEQALREAEARREVLRREIEQLQGTEQGVLQLTRHALERHLEGMTEKLRSGDTGRVREAIRASVERIVVGEDGTLSMDVKPEGLLGGQAPIAHLWCRGRESNPHGASPAGF